MQLIIDTISKVKVGEAKTFKNLTVFPILGAVGAAADYITLDEALAEKIASVTEVDESGRVPELKFTNSGDRRVFLLDGEELIGAKQNRVLNLSILVPADKTIVIPVSCVESGRWRQRSREFSSAPRAHYAEGRAKKMSQVSASPPGRADAEAFLEAAAKTQSEEFPAVGEGRDLRLATPGLAGAALESNERIVHLCAFAVGDAPGQQQV